MDRKVIILGIVGGTAALGYVLYRRQKEQEAAALLAAGIQPVRPGVFETVTGALTSVFSEGLSKLSQPSTPTEAKTGIEALSAKMQARGTTHFLAWSAAFRTGKSFYVVGAKCFRTADGAEVPTSNCPVLQLEGYY